MKFVGGDCLIHCSDLSWGFFFLFFFSFKDLFVYFRQSAEVGGGRGRARKKPQTLPVWSVEPETGLPLLIWDHDVSQSQESQAPLTTHRCPSWGSFLLNSYFTSLAFPLLCVFCTFAALSKFSSYIISLFFLFDYFGFCVLVRASLTNVVILVVCGGWNWEIGSRLEALGSRASCQLQAVLREGFGPRPLWPAFLSSCFPEGRIFWSPASRWKPSCQVFCHKVGGREQVSQKSVCTFHLILFSV